MKEDNKGSVNESLSWTRFFWAGKSTQSSNTLTSDSLSSDNLSSNQALSGNIQSHQSNQTSSDQPSCPVDHETRNSWANVWKSKESKPTPEPQKAPESQPACPVDHSTRQEWVKNVSVTSTAKPDSIEVDDKTCTSDDIKTHPHYETNVDLPEERVISSIPRTSGDSNWIYPSEKQFFEAMKRKNWKPEATDMKTVVPIHNTVNERAWKHILFWEKHNYQHALDNCGGIKLTSFQGHPNKLTPRAWIRSTIFGSSKPFDRHDWLIDRCGTEVEYVIDFYSGEGEPSFFLDVRPKLNSWEGIKLRLNNAMGL